MPLFTVSNDTNTCRVLVCKSTVKEVIDSAVSKMKLQGEYKVCL